MTLALAASCGGPGYVACVPLVPPTTVAAPAPPRDSGMRAAADRSAPLPMDQVPPAAPLTSVGYRTVVRVVEVPPAPAAGGGELPPGGAVGAWPELAPPEQAAAARDPVSRFPFGSMVGAGVGAVIGNQSGASGTGALIGGTVGLLFDVARLSW